MAQLFRLGYRISDMTDTDTTSTGDKFVLVHDGASTWVSRAVNSSDVVQSTDEALAYFLSD